MWTFETAAGFMPLVVASGAGAASRQAISTANEVKGGRRAERVQSNSLLLADFFRAPPCNFCTNLPLRDVPLQGF